MSDLDLTTIIPNRVTWASSDIRVRCNGTVYQNRTNGTANYDGSKVGRQNPRWRDQIKLGLNATTPYQRVGARMIVFKPYKIERRALLDCSKLSSNAFVSSIWEGHLAPPTTYSVPAMSQSALNKAIMQLVSDHDAQTTSLLGGVYLKEWKQVRDMIRNPAKALWKEVERYHSQAQRRARGIKQLPKVERILSDLWLEYSFGWVPLISDTQAAAEAAAKILEEKIERFVIRGYGKDEMSAKETFASWAPSGAILIGAKRTLVTETSMVTIKAGIQPEKSVPSKGILALRELGFTPNSFVPTIWEVIPYSFLVDYFVNVGDVLRATFHTWADLAWATQAAVEKSTTTISVMPKVLTEPNYSWSAQTGKTVMEAQRFTRTIPGTLVPKVEFTLPGEPTKWINLAALATMKTVKP